MTINANNDVAARLLYARVQPAWYKAARIVNDGKWDLRMQSGKVLDRLTRGVRGHTIGNNHLKMIARVALGKDRFQALSNEASLITHRHDDRYNGQIVS